MGMHGKRFDLMLVLLPDERFAKFRQVMGLEGVEEILVLQMGEGKWEWGEREGWAAAREGGREVDVLEGKWLD